MRRRGLHRLPDQRDRGPHSAELAGRDDHPDAADRLRVHAGQRPRLGQPDLGGRARLYPHGERQPELVPDRSADIIGTFQIGGDVSMASGLGGEIAYVYNESSQNVTVPGGDSGVSDLGFLSSVLTGGSLWSGTVNFSIQ